MSQRGMTCAFPSVYSTIWILGSDQVQGVQSPGRWTTLSRTPADRAAFCVRRSAYPGQ